MQSKPEAFSLNLPESALDDLRQRLALARFPEQPPGEPWAYGSEVAYMRELTAYWKDRFDWRAAEAALNAFPQFTLPLEGIDLHFLHVEGKGPDPAPLLLLHGWPGSVFEFLEILPRLTDPASFGGDPADAMTVVAPSLPGFGLSFKPGQPRFGLEEMAETLGHLMREVLGYRRYFLQGGDWGSFVATRLAFTDPNDVLGLHLNLLPLRREPAMYDDPAPETQRYLAELKHWMKEETGYQWIQGTKPQTLAYGLTDSPLGLAAWIVEKFRTWTDCDGDVESVLSKDRMLANIAFYWFTGAINSSFWPYYARLHRPWPIPPGATVDVPMGYTAFPKEILRPGRSLAEGLFSDIRRWTEMPRGGHFAAMEQPEALAGEIQAFARPLRG
ncbi:MAG: epoxide hydrolase [Rhodospirillales bacterium]